MSLTRQFFATLVLPFWLLSAFPLYAESFQFAVPRRAPSPFTEVAESEIDETSLLIYCFERNSFCELNARYAWTEQPLERMLDALVTTESGRTVYQTILPKIRRKQVALRPLPFNDDNCQKYSLPEQACAFTKNESGVWVVYLNQNCEIGNFLPELGAAFHRINILVGGDLTRERLNESRFFEATYQLEIRRQLAAEFDALKRYYLWQDERPTPVRNSIVALLAKWRADEHFCKLEMVDDTSGTRP